MALEFEPLVGTPAAVATCGGDRLLVVSDYHAGIEAGLRRERGVEVPSRAQNRREQLLSLLERTAPDRLVICGDFMHAIADPGGAERGELEVLCESVAERRPELTVTLVKGNHDGAIESWLEETALEITVVPGDGIRCGPLGLCHGHRWPTRAVLEADLVCLGHEHPSVKLEDEVGGRRVERVWMRGRLAPEPFRGRPEYEGLEWLTGVEPAPQLVVMPAFNDLSGGTWVNVPGQNFLAPFFPAGIAEADAYLLDGTRLGPYQSL